MIYRRAVSGCPPDNASKWDAEQIDPGALADQELELGLWSNEDPGLQPTAQAAIVIRAEAPYSHFARFRRGKGHRTAEYIEYKARLGKALVDEVKKLLPDSIMPS